MIQSYPCDSSELVVGIFHPEEYESVFQGRTQGFGYDAE